MIYYNRNDKLNIFQMDIVPCDGPLSQIMMIIVTAEK